MKDAESLNTIEELKQQVKYMKIEKQLARIEEDSLISQNDSGKSKEPQTSG